MQLRVGGVPEHFNLPWHLAMESGRLDASGATVVWSDQPGGTGEMTAALAYDRLDMIVALTEGLTAAIANGLAARMLRLYTSSPLQWGVHVAGPSPLDAASLAGARFAISRFGSGSHLMAHVLADRLGLAINDDSFVPVGDLDGARQALGGGTAEVFMWDRFMTSPLVASGEFRRIDVQPTPWPAFTVAVADRVLARHGRAGLDAVLDEVAAQAETFVTRPDAVELVAGRYGLELVEAQAWLDVTEFADVPQIDPTIVVAVEQRLVDLRIIDRLAGPAHYLAPSTSRPA